MSKSLSSLSGERVDSRKQRMMRAQQWDPLQCHSEGRSVLQESEYVKRVVKSSRCQPLWQPVQRRAVIKIIYVEAAKQSVPVALWVDRRRGVEADPLTQHRLKQANEMCAQHRFSALKPRGTTKPDFSRVSFLLPRVFAGQLWKYSSWVWTLALGLFKRKEEKKIISLLINLLFLSSASSLLNYC